MFPFHIDLHHFGRKKHSEAKVVNKAHAAK